jgi:hypothetical protein
LARGLLGSCAEFGEDGWCHACGVPKGPQTGSIVLQPKGFKVAEGGWVPNWQFNAICLESSLAEDAASRFQLDLLKVEWHGVPSGQAQQIVVPSVGESWFDHDELSVRRSTNTAQREPGVLTAARGGGCRWPSERCRR